MAKLSVVIPVYQVEPYLRSCLNSMIRQTWTDLEILLIDDGSPDRCGEICDAYAAWDPRIRVVHQENAGLCAARNRGIDLARGEYLAFADSDDWVGEDYYKTMMRAMLRSGADLAMSNYCRNEGDTETEIRFLRQAGVTGDPDRIRTFQMSVLTPYYSHQKHGACFCWNKVFRRDFIKKHALYFQDVQAQEDLIHSFQALQYARRVAYLPAAGYHYRFVPDSNMSGYRPDRDERDNKALQILYRLAGQYQVSPEVYDALYAFTVESVRPMVWCSIFHPENSQSFRDRLRRLRRILHAEPYWLAFTRADIRLLEPPCKPCALFRTHSAFYFYLLHGLQGLKRKIFGIKKY